MASFDFILALPIYEVRQYFNKAFENTYFKELKSLILKRIDGISDKEIKNVSKDTIYYILAQLKSISDTDGNFDIYELKLVKRFIESPFMEKRLKGIAELKDLIEMISDQFRKRLRSFNSERLAKWLVDNCILESVMHVAHEEMIKRSSIIFTFVAFHKLFTEEHLNLLWTYIKDRHDSIQTAVYSVILDINRYLEKNLQKVLFNKFLDIEVFDEKLIETFTELIKKNEVLCENSADFFFKIIMNESVNSEIAIESFQQVLSGTKNFATMKSYLEKSLLNIKNEENVCQSLLVILAIFKLQLPSVHKSELLKLLDASEESFVGLLTKSFSSIQNEKKTENLNKSIRIRIKFWKFFVTNCERSIDADEIIKVKDAFVKLNIQEAHERVWSTLHTLIKTRFTHDTNYEILDKVFLCRDPNEVVNDTNFEIFLTLFLKVNDQLRNIELRHEKFHSRLNASIAGYPFLIDCVFGNLSGSIETRSMKIITSLNIKFSKSLYTQSKEIWEFYLNSLQKFLDKDPKHVEKALRLVLQFLEGYKKEDLPDASFTVLYRLKTEPEYTKLSVNPNVTIATLRKKIADLYKKPLSDLLLVTNSDERIDYLYDDFLLSTWKAPLVLTVDFSGYKKAPVPIEFFRECQDFLEKLLEILPNLNKTNAELAWTILNRVSLIEKYVNRFKTFESITPQVFTTSSIYQLVYSLKIIESLIKSPVWLDEFRAKSGIEQIQSVFLTHSLNSEDSLLLEYNLLIVSIVNSTKSYIDSFSAEFIVKLLDCIIQAALLYNGGEDSSNIAKNAKDVLAICRNKSRNTFLETLKSFSLALLIEATVIKCPCNYLSSTLSSFFLEQSSNISDLTPIFLSNLLSLVDEALKFSKTDSYWNLLSFYISDCELTEDLKSKFVTFISYIDSRQAENSSKEPDIVLSGLLKVLKTIVHKVDFPVTKEFVHLLLHDCLFEIPTKLNMSAPKCKHSETRRDAFDLLSELCKRSQDVLDYILDYLRIQYQDPSWRGCKHADWNYHPRANEKSDTGFVGMKNLGCICYMLSSLQQFYHIEHFRESLLRIKVKEEKIEDSLLYQLQNLYSGLKNSDKQHVNPKGVCKAFKDWEGRPVNVREQMDADEFINTFMDRIETQIKGYQEEHIVKELFGGQLVTELIGQGSCSHRSEVTEAFITLPVQVKGQKSLNESLNTFKVGEMLQGSNAYQCDHCESKVTALRRVCIKHLPNVLMVTLRRFEFNYDSMKRLKLNDFCEFPMDLDMESFTQEGIERMESCKEREMEGETDVAVTKKHPDDYYKYKLRGAIIHLGTAEAGHYYSFVKVGEEWYEFNDTIVRKIDSLDISNEAFGGEEKTLLSSNAQSVRWKNRNAYILFYERSSYYLYNKEEESLNPLKFNLSSHEIEFSEVKEENEKYWRCKLSFSPEYFEFVKSLLEFNSEKTSKFAISFFVTVMIRSRDYSRIAETLKIIKERITGNIELSEWVLELGSNKNIIKELLLDCPVTEKRRLLVSLFAAASEAVDKSSQEEYVKRLLVHIDSAKKPASLNFCNYFELLFRLACQNPRIIQKLDLQTRLTNYLQNLPQDPIETLPFKYKDVSLGYDSYTPDEKAEQSLGLNGTSSIFIFKLLTLAFSNSKNEDADYFFSENFLDHYSPEASSRHFGRVLGNFLSSLCKDNKTNTGRYALFLVQKINDANHDKHKIYMRQLYCLLSLQDSLTSERTEFIMSRYLKQIIINKKYPLATESSIDFLIKAANKILAVSQWLQKKKSDIRILETILPEVMTRAVAKSKEPFIVRSPMLRIENLKKLLKGNFSAIELEESDGETFENELPKNSSLEVFEVQLQKWVPCTIHTSSQEVLNIRNEAEGVNKWIDSLSDSLRVVKKHS